MLVLEQRRKELDMSREELSRLTGASLSAIVSIEQGRVSPYPLRTLRIARALGWMGDPNELLKRTKPNPNKQQPKGTTMTNDEFELTATEKAECAERARKLASSPGASQNYETILSIQESKVRQKKIDTAHREAYEQQRKEAEESIAAQREEEEKARQARWNNPVEELARQELRRTILDIPDSRERHAAIAANLDLFD